jgi:hypothetical protein
MWVPHFLSLVFVSVLQDADHSSGNAHTNMHSMYARTNSNATHIDLPSISFSNSAL